MIKAGRPVQEVMNWARDDIAKQKELDAVKSREQQEKDDKTAVNQAWLDTKSAELETTEKVKTATTEYPQDFTLIISLESAEERARLIGVLKDNGFHGRLVKGAKTA
jgi:hypothetical protein